MTPVTARLGPQSRGALEDIFDCLAHRVLVGEVELDAADIRFVDDIRRQDLDRDRAAVGEGRPRRFDGFFGEGRAGREAQPGCRMPASRALTSSGSSQRRLAAIAPATIVCAFATSGTKSCGRLSGVSINSFCASR